MNIYFAVTELDKVITENTNNYLCSYFYFNSQTQVVSIKKAQRAFPDNKLFIDSGAFSAYSTGENIILRDYCLFLKSIKPTLYAGLDVIGDPIKTMQNQEYMEKEYGLDPIPTFHVGEERKYLDRILEKYDYLALGGMVYAKDLVDFLDNVWSIILKEKPEMKVHGFGLTNQKHIERYPWYSIDSSSHDRAGRYGLVTLLNSNNTIYTVKVKDWIQNHIKDGGDSEVATVPKKLREVTVKLSMKAYTDCIKVITEKHKKRDFNYLTNQQDLFGGGF